jgi:hypothetical protein
MVAITITITTTVRNGTITIPVLNRNCYVRNLCSILESQSDVEQGPTQPSFKCYTKAKLSWALLNVRATLQP